MPRWHWHVFQELLSQFGKLNKLYINEGFGRAYFEKFDEASAAYAQLNNKPPHYLVISDPATPPTMNYRNQSRYHKNDIEECLVAYQFTDIFGRLVAAFEGEDGDLYISVADLKKSGFELYEIGTLPKPGSSKIFDEQLLSQLEMYLKMKAAKFLSVHKLNVPDDYVDCIVKRELKQHSAPKLPERSVKFDAAGLVKISSELKDAQPSPPANRGRLSLAQDTCKPYNSNKPSPYKLSLNNQNAKVPDGRISDHKPVEEGTRPDNNNATNGISKDGCTNNASKKKTFSYNNDRSNTGNSNASDKDDNWTKPQQKAKEIPKLTELTELSLAVIQPKIEETPKSSPTPTAEALPIGAITTIKTKTTPSRKSVVELTNSDSGLLECIKVLTDTAFVAFVFPEQFRAQVFALETIGNEADSSSFTAEVGDFVAAWNDDLYARASILGKTSDGKYTCALVDYGTVIHTEDIRRLPEKFEEIPEFTCVCRGNVQDVKDIFDKAGNNINATFVSPGVVRVRLEFSNKDLELTATKWDPFESLVPESKKEVEPTVETVYKLKPPVNKLNDQDIVMIVNQLEGYLLVRTKGTNMLLKQVNQELANYKGQALDKSPEIGQLAVASFNDNILYRVVIQSIDNNTATVEYVDYGNSNKVPIEELLNANERLAEIDNTLIKMVLKGFHGREKFSRSLLSALEEYSVKKEKFIVVATAAENEYDLMMSDQTSLSHTLKLLDLQEILKLVPNNKLIKKSASPPLVVLMNDLPPCRFQIGHNSVICMYKGDLKEGNVSFCLNDPETSDLLMEVQSKIENADKSTMYEPVIDEICLAKFAGEWYRACLMEKKDDKYTVFYLDFGNSQTVSLAEICKIPLELTTIEPLASICILKGVIPEMEETIPESLLKVMEKDLNENETYSIDVLENIQGYLIITIPALYTNWKLL